MRKKADPIFLGFVFCLVLGAILFTFQSCKKDSPSAEQPDSLRTFSYDWEPSWSPDGEWLLYVSGQVPDIFVMRADGSETYRLTQDRFEDSAPVWQP